MTREWRTDAMEEIARLEEENARLRDELGEKMDAAALHYGKVIEQKDAELARIRNQASELNMMNAEQKSELARLREALRVIEQSADSTNWRQAREIARNALKETTRSEYAPGSGYNDDPVTGQ